jgi:hypothetical protein
MQLTSTTTILTEPPCTQCSWRICLEWKCLMHFLFHLWTVQRTATQVWKLSFADWHLTYAFVNLFLCFVYGHGKACDERWAVACRAINSKLSTMRVAKRWAVACRAINSKLSTMRVAMPRHSTSFAAVMAVSFATLSLQWRHIGTTSESSRGIVDDVTLLWWRHVDTNGSQCCWENWCDPTKKRIQKHLFDDF